MFDWLKKGLSARKKVASSNAFGGALSKLPDQAELMDQSSTYKKEGDVQFNQGKFAEAAACYREAIACNPDYAEALNNLGNACRELELFEDAERCLRQAAAIKPLPNVHYNLASLLLERGNLLEAIENFDKEVKCNPKHYAALALKLFHMQNICVWEDLESSAITLRQSVAAPYEPAEAIFSPFTFIALPGTTPGEQKRCAEKWAQSQYQSLIEVRNQLAFSHNRPWNKKIAVGYISGDFREHPLARLTAEMFELHNRAQFHITAYSYGPDDGSEMRKRLINAFDAFVDIRNHSDIDAARRIYADQIDILVDMTGYTRNSRSGILALRPAPLQLSHLGYLGTMGADFVDYLIADHFIVPSESQKDYTEKILYLPNCFQPNDRARQRLPAPTRESCGLPDCGFVYCCFNQTYKITPDVFHIWCRLLMATPDSVLWIYAGTTYAEENFRSKASIHGVDPQRLVIAPKVSAEKYLARMQCADLFLDTSPYNAGTTCSDALWMGLPVVTCVGKTFSSRMAGSLISTMGVPELITYNLEDYYNLALNLTTDRTKLLAIRNRIIATRETSPLFDSALFTRNLESAYVKLMENSTSVMHSR